MSGRVELFPVACLGLDEEDQVEKSVEIVSRHLLPSGVSHIESLIILEPILDFLQSGVGKMEGIGLKSLGDRSVIKNAVEAVTFAENIPGDEGNIEKNPGARPASEGADEKNKDLVVVNIVFCDIACFIDGF